MLSFAILSYPILCYPMLSTLSILCTRSIQSIRFFSFPFFSVLFRLYKISGDDSDDEIADEAEDAYN